MSARHMLFCVLLAVAAGCAAEQKYSPKPETPEARAGHIRMLIEKLAISQGPAGDFPIYTPSEDAPRTDPRVMAHDAAEELHTYGMEAWLHLLENLDDKRQSVAFYRMIPHDVGLACYAIIDFQIDACPGYRGPMYRTGSDGKSHARPSFETPLYTPDLKSWLAARKGKTLHQLQIEAVEWRIAEETRIGFPTQKDRTEYLTPLLERLKELRSQSGASERE